MSVNDDEVCTNERKIRFRPAAKVLFNSESKIEDLLKYDKSETSMDEPDSGKREKSPSLFSFLQTEVTRDYVLEHDEERYSARREKVYSFMKIPREVEKFMTYGFMQCTDSFLFVYTFLPVRVLLATWGLVTRPITKCFGFQRKFNRSLLTPAEKCDILKAVILVLCSMLMFYVDTNMMYHLIKSQSVIKLYIFYNMLEVGDRLFSAFGQDTIDALFWTATEPRDRKREHLGLIPHLLFAIIYVLLHSLLVLFQATTLNVAINSNNKALLTIMMSNNFVELKGSVFKKFDKNNLFQVTCSDVRERFHLVVLLFIVMLQTMKEYSWKSDRFWILVPDCLMVLLAEILVDWIKHAFITRFNELQVDVYKDYTTSLAYDMAQTRQKHAFSDHSDLVARRMGFIPLPLGVVMVRILMHTVQLNDVASFLISTAAYFWLATWKILNSIVILGVACNLIAQHKQEKATVNSPLNNRANSPIGPRSTTTIPTNASTPQKAVPPPETAGLPTADISLGPAAIFSNSTVDLKNVTLNDELLKAETELAESEKDDLTRSDPVINVIEERIEVVENGIKKRAESEPSLNTINDEEPV